MTVQTSPAPLSFEGITNFRDFGGWPTQNGCRVRQGLLYRSAHHAGATPADLERLAELGVTLVVDLRRPPERRRDPTPSHGTFSPRVLHDEITPDVDAISPHLAFLNNGDKGRHWVVEWLTTSYGAYPFDPAYSTLFRNYFHALVDTEGAALVHCAAGKDRTGVLCALTLHALGVDREAIYRDYLETNQLDTLEERIASLRRRDYGRDFDPETARAAMSADTRYLDAAFASIEARHADVDAYLTEVLGVTPQVREKLRARLVTQA
jgi:protein tyrosine/serine phosphatase